MMLLLQTVLHQQKRIEFHFGREKFTKNVIINYIIDECALCVIVDLNALVFNLEEVVTIMKNNKTLRLRKGMIKDSSDKMAAKSLIEKESDGSCYDFANMRKRRYLDERV